MTNVESFYQNQGWETNQGLTTDAHLNEDLRPCAAEYVSKCRLRLMPYIPTKGDKILDMASGPIQYPEYLEYSKNFQQRVCVDYSEQALRLAEEKIADHGQFHCGDFLKMDFPENHFDCSISLHTIYHIHLDLQETVVRKLLKITKKGAPVIIVSKNPNLWIKYPVALVKKILKVFHLKNNNDTIQLYHDAHPIEWWKQFEDMADVEIIPWRSFSAKHQKILFPSFLFAKIMFKALYALEETFPQLFVRHFKFPMIILKKK